MNYNNNNVRRQDRLMPEDEAIELLKNGEYAYLSMLSEEGQPYGIPISYVWNGKSSIYFHCAPEGKKLRAIQHNQRVSFCIVGYTKVISNKFTTEYQSIVASGKISLIEDEKECYHALEIFLDKYSPNDKTLGMKYVKKSFHRTRMLRMDLDEWSGKRKKVM